MTYRSRAIALALAVAAVASLGACTDPSSQGAARVAGPVGRPMVAEVKSLIARGDKVIEFGTSAMPPAGWEAHSGGDSAAGWEIADALHDAGVTARCVGFCGSAMSQIVIGSGKCAVTANAVLMPHLGFVEGGTREQNRAASLQTSREWLERGFPVDLVDRLEHSADNTIRVRTEDMARIGCKIE